MPTYSSIFIMMAPDICLLTFESRSHGEDGREEKKILNSSRTLRNGSQEDVRRVLDELSNVMVKLKAMFVGRTVDYEVLRSHRTFKELKEVAAKLQLVKTLELNRNERLSMFLNAYNAMTIHGLVCMENLPKSVLEGHMFWKSAVYKIGGELFSLDDIQHGILRGNRPWPTSCSKPFSVADSRTALTITDVDPRIHFALSCGAKSGPEFRVYTAENLDEELTEATVKFCNDDDVLQLDVTKNVICLSRIFRWYEKDFAKNDVEMIRQVTVDTGLLPFLSKEKRNRTEQLLEELESSGRVRITYKEFNWELNSTQRH